MSLGAKVAIGIAALAAGGVAVWMAVTSGDGESAVPGVSSGPTNGGETSEDTDEEDDDPVALDVLGPGTPPAVVAGSFDLGPVEQLAAATVGPEGGVVVSPDGLLIDVPDGAHHGTRSYTVAKQQILGHDFQNGVNPVSALYTVENGGDLAADAVWVEVPAEVPPGGFAMGFMYDPTTRALEALPLIAVGTDSVVIATGHFSQFFVHGVDAATFTVTVGVEAATQAQSQGPTQIVDTGFRPGVDDWSFKNFGSYSAPRGHCAGQSLSAMWYFVERAKNGAPSLHASFDNDGLGATERWQDDRRGYRLASAVQSDYGDRVLTWVERAQRYFDQWRLELAADDPDAANFDLWQFAAFVTAIQVTGEPQYVAISRLYTPTPGAGTTTTAVPEPRRGGHAMIVYGADTRGLWIADPNKSGKFRRIPWDAATSTLGPYYSGPDATTQGRRYDAINLMGKTSLVDWAGVGLRFADADVGVAGDDVFPDYQLEVLEEAADGTGAWVPLEDGYTTHHHGIKVRMTFSVTASWRVTRCEGTDRTACRAGPDGAHTTPIDVFLHNDGDNPIELLIEGWASNERWEYVDFARVTVHRSPALDLTVVPPTQTVAPDEAVAFRVEVTNLGADVLFIDVSVDNPDSGEVCSAELGSLAGGATESVDCSFAPKMGPGIHTYEVFALAYVSALAYDANFVRSVFTEITIGEPAVAPVGDIVDALNTLHEIVLGVPGEARELPPAGNTGFLTSSPEPIAVYTVNSAMPVYVGVYATEEDARDALQAIADEVAAEVDANTGSGVHWCDWYRITLDRGQFHGGDSFTLAYIQKEVDSEPDQPGVQSPRADVAWCNSTESEILAGNGYPVVESSSERTGWVQGNLVVTLNRAWTPDSAEVAYAQLAAVLGD